MHSNYAEDTVRREKKKKQPQEVPVFVRVLRE